MKIPVNLGDKNTHMIQYIPSMSTSNVYFPYFDITSVVVVVVVVVFVVVVQVLRHEIFSSSFSTGWTLLNYFSSPF
jgi:hypothetical protein